MESIGTQSSCNALFLCVHHRGQGTQSFCPGGSNLIFVVSTVTHRIGTLSWNCLVLKMVSPRNRQQSEQEAEYHTVISVCSSVCVIVEWRKSHIPALSVITEVTEDFWWTTVLLLVGDGSDADCDQISSSRSWTWDLVTWNQKYLWLP